jgi:hypothetical protein
LVTASENLAGWGSGQHDLYGQQAYKVELCK